MRDESTGRSKRRSRYSEEEPTPIFEEEENQEFDLRNVISTRRRNKQRRLDLDTTTTTTTTTTTPASTGTSRTLVMLSGLPDGCSVLELKSRFEMYGPVSRIRNEGGGTAFVSYRSSDSALAAVSASVEPGGSGVVFQSKRVQAYLVVEPQVKMGFSRSNLLRSEIPLSKHGRSNKKLNASSSLNPRAPVILPFNYRKVIAYDDL